MRKWLRRVGYGLLGLLGLVVVLVALPFVVALFPGGRAFILDKGLEQANANLPIRIAVKSLDRLDPWGVDIAGIAVNDAKGKPLARLEGLSVRIAPFALVGGKLQLPRVSIAHGHADVPSLVDAFSTPEEPAKEEPQEESSGGLDYQVDDLAVLDVKARVQSGEKLLDVEVATLRAAGAYGSQTSVVLSALSAKAFDAQGELVALSTKTAEFTLAEGGHVEITGHAGDSTILIRAEVGAVRDDGSWPEGKAHVALGQVSRATLARLGVEGFTLQRPLDVQVDATQKDQRFTLALAVSDAARQLLQVKGQGALDDAAIDVAIAPLALAELAPELPEMTVRGKLHVTFAGEFDDGRFSLAWADVQVDQQAVPNGNLRGELDAESVTLDELKIAGFEDKLSVHGSYAFEPGTADAELSLKPTELGSVPFMRAQGVSGKVRAEIAFEGGAEGPLEGKADVLIEALQQVTPSKEKGQPPTVMKLARAELKALVDGTLDRPEGKANALLVGLSAQSARVDDAAFDVTMDEDGKLAGTLRVRAPDVSLNGRMKGAQRDATRTFELDASGKLRDEGLLLAARASSTENKETVARVEASVGAQLINAQGSVSANDRLNAKLDARNLDVAFWAKLFGQEDVRGTIDLTANASGTTKKPIVAAQVLGHDLCGMGQPETDLQLSARAEIAARRYALTLGAYGKTDPLRIEVTADTVLPARAKTAIDYLEGPFEAHVVVHVPASRLASLDEAHLAPLKGAIDVALDAKGEKEELAAELRVDAAMRLPTGEDNRQDKLSLRVAVDPQRVKLDAVAHDRDGKLLTMNGALKWPGGSLAAATDAEAWKTVPRFRLSAKLEDRRLDLIQGVFAYLAGLYEMDMPLRVGTQVELVGDNGELSGAVNGKAMLLADVLDPSCALGTQLNSSFDIALARGEAKLSVWARDMEGGTIRVEAQQKLKIVPESPPESWLGATDVTAEGRNISLRKLPGMCELASGRAAFVAKASALGGRPPFAQLELGVEDMRSGRAEPVALQVVAALATNKLSAEGQLDVRNQKRGTFAASVPVVLKKDSFAPELSAKTPVTARLDLKKLPVAPFLGIGDAVGRPSGHIDASLRVVGPLEKPKPSGFVALDDVSFTLSSSAQPLQHVRGRIEIDDHRLIVKDLEAHDGEGVLKVDGEATYKDDGTGQGKLSLRANEMPLRRQGEIIGELSMRTEVEARVPPSHLAEIEVQIQEGRVWMTGDTGRAVQSLEPNPDVRFVDVPQAERKVAAEEEAADAKAPKMGFASMTIKTSERDLWIMHESFSVQVGVDLRFVQEKVPVLKGEVALRRGELQILGKLFSVQRGAVRLTGDVPPDPELEIRAIHKLPSGDQLIVMVSGRGSAPVIAFGGAATNAGEAVALLSGVGKSGAETKAQDDARNFATNLTAGLLTVAARREFGDWVPVLGIENDESGAVSGARAGFDATKLIPKPLRGFARAAYVEGIVGSTEESGGNVGVGVKIEVVLPADIVTSWGYGPGATWSTDVAWVP
jgi:autotransporter translocation and assembly factor TamB